MAVFFAFFKKPAFFLRLGLGSMYLYSGFDLVVHPDHWRQFITDAPTLVFNLVNAFGIDNFLRLQGVFELILGLGFLAWFLPRRVLPYLSGLAALEMVGILFTVEINLITFRDLGLLGAVLTLFIYSKQNNPNNLVANSS